VKPLELTPGPLDRGGAEISNCGSYRYMLWRRWEDGPYLVACMLNPSTADAYKADSTVRKLIGFAKRTGHGSIMIVNLFAYRTPYPKELAAAHRAGVDIVGPENTEVLSGVMRTTKERGYTFLVGWGSQKTKAVADLVELHARSVQLAALGLGIELKCLGTAKDGSPRHPLMLSYDTPLQPWRHPAMEELCSKP